MLPPFNYKPKLNNINEIQLLFVLNKINCSLQLNYFQAIEKYIQITHVKHRLRPNKKY